VIWKFLHVLGVVLMLGNVIATGLWAHWAMALRDRQLAAFAAGAILWADLLLTLTGGAMLTIGGLKLALDMGLAWDLPWLKQGVLALAASTGAWLAVLLPLQVVMLRAAKAGDTARLRKAYRWWAVLGWADTVVLVWGLWVMVAKGAA
jgi:uncharacterized membrane protein